MNRVIASIFSFSIIACEDAGTKDFSQIDVEDSHQDPFNHSPNDHLEEVEALEVNVQTPQPELICASGGLYDADGNFQTLRMELYQRDDKIEIHASKGAIHPTAESIFNTAILEQEGTIGSEFLQLMINDEYIISGELGLDSSLIIELGRLEANHQLFYQGMFSQFGCGPYGSYNSVTCWEPDIEAEFSYNELNGVCLNAEKETGFNPWTVEMIRETTDGQCARLDLVSLNEGDFEYPELSWDLRGSDLRYAQLEAASFHNAQFEGARLDELYYWDSEITGSIDEFTILPNGCEETGSELYCKQ